VNAKGTFRAKWIWLGDAPHSELKNTKEPHVPVVLVAASQA